MRRLLLFLVVVVGCNAQEYTGAEGSGPHMVKEPVDTVFNEDSNIQSVHLECEAEGDESPSYTWKRKDKGSSTWEPVDVEGQDRYQLSRGRLSITDPDSFFDEGSYQCFPSNQIGTIMSKKAKLEFAYLRGFPQDGPPVQSIPINSGACITCDLPEYYPAVTMIWSTTTPIFPEAKYHITPDGRFCFANFKASDAGQYVCYARNVIDTGGASVTKYSAGFEVTSEPQVSASDQHGPTVAIAVEDQTVILNQPEVTLSCFFFGNPLPSIDWRRKSPAGAGLPVLVEKRLSNQFLVLKNIQLEDAGEYECYTLDGAATSSATIQVKVPPSWVQELSDVKGNIYESLSRECEAESPDGVTYTWYVNATEIDSLPGFQLSNGLKTLTIQNLTTEHTGMYQCKASNDYGEIYTTSELIVLAIIPYFKVDLMMEQAAPRGGTVTIECNPTASPTPTIQWTKGSLAISTDGHYTVLDNGDLMISEVADSDGGEYTCTASNSQGTGSSTGSLVIRDGTAIVDPPVAVTINEGDMGTLTCRASHDLFFDLQYVWMKDGTQVDLGLPNYEQPEISTGEESQLHIKDATLDLAGEYTCTAVTTIDDAAASSVVTVRGRPGAPAGVAVAVAGLAANISWSHGADNNSPITSYIIEGSTNHVPEWEVLQSDIPASSTHARVTGLSGWSVYKFRVVAVNDVGRGEPSEESDELETAQGRPTEVPSNVGGGGGNEGDLRITWDPLARKDWNAPELMYLVFWRQEDVEDFEQAEVAGTEGTYTASGVPPYTPFMVRIQVKNSRGDGPMTEWYQVYSFQRRPEEAPTGVVAEPQMATSFFVTWIGINTANIIGELKGYKVKFWPDDSTEELGMIQIVLGETTEAVVENLEPDTLYNLKVMAYSGGGDGPLNTETVTVTTLRSLTTPEMPVQSPTPIGSTPRQAPAGVKVTAKGTNSMTVKWNAITTAANEEPLLGYKIMYWPQGDFEADAMVEKVDKSTTQLTIDGLDKGKTYYVKIKGYSSGGDGVASEPPQEVMIGEKNETLPRGAASVMTTSVLLALLPLLVAFHLR